MRIIKDSTRSLRVSCWFVDHAFLSHVETLFCISSWAIMVRKLVRPDNVERVKEEASAGNAHHLEKTCADYIEDNLRFVKMFRD